MICVADALFQYREPDYADFQRKLLPTVEPNRIIGVRAPMLRKLTKAWSREAEKLNARRNIKKEVLFFIFFP